MTRKKILKKITKRFIFPAFYFRSSTAIRDTCPAFRCKTYNFFSRVLLAYRESNRIYYLYYRIIRESTESLFSQPASDDSESIYEAGSKYTLDIMCESFLRWNFAIGDRCQSKQSQEFHRFLDCTRCPSGWFSKSLCVVNRVVKKKKNKKKSLALASLLRVYGRNGGKKRICGAQTFRLQWESSRLLSFDAYEFWNNASTYTLRVAAMRIRDSSTDRQYIYTHTHTSRNFFLRTEFFCYFTSVRSETTVMVLRDL